MASQCIFLGIFLADYPGDFFGGKHLESLEFVTEATKIQWLS